MSDLSVIILSGVALLIFFSNIYYAQKQHSFRIRYMDTLINKAEGLIDKPDPQLIKRTALNEYKNSKRVRLIVDGKVVQNFTLNEWELMAVKNGVDPSEDIEFRIGIAKADEGDILNFPSN